MSLPVDARVRTLLVAPSGTANSSSSSIEIADSATHPVTGDRLASTVGVAVTDPAAIKTWPLNHLRLLYMLSRFAMYPSSTDEEEKWLRSLPLLVLVYEAIVACILDYDYSPVCTNIVKNGRSKRVWLNTSQDAKAAIDDLREHELINALKTCSEDFQPSTAFQVTPNATKLLESFSVLEKKKIDAFLSTTMSNQHELVPTNSGMIIFDSGLLKVSFDVDDGKFRFIRCDGSIVVSKVTDVEGVSYVSSPYLPSCLMRAEATFSSNAHQIAKCKQGVSGINDELSFAIVLSNVRVMVGEWIPFGRNQIVTLNDRLGSLERCQGGLFTSELDGHPTETTLRIEPGLTKIAIVDFEFDSFTNFEADIHAPQADGIVQIESFGMHLHGDGTIIYGMFIEAIMDQTADTIYVDHLSRLLVDVDLDSSKIINDLLSPHQRGLMDMLFMDDARSRNKFSLITAQEIYPRLPVREYLDRGERENELKQVLGEIHSAYDLSEHEKIIIGREGMLLLGPAAHDHEPLIVAHLALLSRELFVRFFFKRTFILDDMLNLARAYLKSFEQNPEALAAMRRKVNRCSHDLMMLEEILALLRDSMRAVQLPPCPTDRAGRLLYEQLELKKTHMDLEIRCKDLAKLLRGFRAKLKQVQSQNGNMAKIMLARIVENVERNMGVMAEAAGVSERAAAASYDLLLLLFAGFFTFGLIDRITDGKLLGIDGHALPSVQWVRDLLVKHVLQHPMAWFSLDVSWMLVITTLLNAVTALVIRRLTRTQSVRFVVHQRINIAAFERVVQQRPLESRTSNFTQDTKILTVSWFETADAEPLVRWHRRRWPALNIAPPLRAQVTVDLVHHFLLHVSFHGKISPRPRELLEKLLDDLKSGGCFDDNYTPPTIGKNTSVASASWRKGISRRLLSKSRRAVHPTE